MRALPHSSNPAHGASLAAVVLPMDAAAQPAAVGVRTSAPEVRFLHPGIGGGMRFLHPDLLGGMHFFSLGCNYGDSPGGVNQPAVM